MDNVNQEVVSIFRIPGSIV